MKLNPNMKALWGKLLGVGLGLMACSLSAQPVITNQPADQIGVVGGSATFNVTASGNGPFTYHWQMNGTNLPSTNIITTVAGNGGTGFNGDGGQATNTTLYYSYAVVVDQMGNFFVADTSNRRVRKVDTNGIITTVAGTGSIGFTGDGGPATSATLNQPKGVALDGYGNLYISDWANSRIRKVDTNGNISTIIGTNGIGFSGDGSPAYLAKISGPQNLTVDSWGNILVADTGNNRIRKIDTNGIITTIAGTNASGLSGDGGPANIARLSSPYGVNVDTFGNLLIADTYNNRIRKVDTNGIITTLSGTISGFSGDGGSAINAKLSLPSQVVPDSFGNLFIADTINHRIRMVDKSGNISTLAGTNAFGFSSDGVAATNSKLNSPFGLALDASGNLLIADSNNHRIRRVGISGAPIFNLQTLTTNNFGSYQVVATSPSGSVTSSIANLAVVYTLSPTNVSVTNGMATNLAVTVFGTGSFSYQWYFNTNTAVDGGTNATLLFTNAAYGQRGYYFCVVSNSSGMAVTSSVVKLTIIVFPPSITTQPNFARVVVGGSTNLNVAVSGDGPYGYQWFISSGRTATATPFISGGRITSVLVNDLGMGYTSTPQVHFVGGSGSGATASAFAISGGVVSITVMNQGSGYTTAAPTVQIDPPPMTTTLLTGQTNATLNFSPAALTDGTNYFVVITNNYGSVTSAAAYLWVFVPPQNFNIGNVGTTNGGQISLQLSGTPNYPYILQSVTNLTPPVNWKSIRTNNADSNGNWSFTATNLSVTPNLYYRAVGQ